MVVGDVRKMRWWKSTLLYFAFSRRRRIGLLDVVFACCLFDLDLALHSRAAF